MKKIILILVVFAFAVSTVFAANLNEGFETWPPADWTIVQGACSPTNDITQNGDQFFDGIYSARFSSYSSCATYDEYLVTPELITTDGDQTISFMYKRYSSGSELFKVGWSSTGTDLSTDFTWSDEINDATVDWQEYSKTDLPIGTKFVAIHYYSNYMYYFYLDAVMGPEIVPNLAPAITDYSLVQSVDLMDWVPVVDEVIVDPVFDYTYLNIDMMTTTLPLMVGELNPFFVETYPAGWFDYWAAKGVIEGAESWQAVMWEIINGNAPIMYIKYLDPGYMLVDGLQYQIQQGELNLRVSGDYLLGAYTYTGTVLSAGGVSSEVVTIPLTFDEPFYALQGDLCGDPILLTLPAVDVLGTSDGFMNDYSFAGSSYMNGIDIVYEITIDADGGFMQGSLATDGYGYPGLFILDACPDGEYNTIYNGGSSQLLAFEGIPIDMGTYYVVVSNWPSPYDFTYTLNMEWYEWVPDPGEVCENALPVEMNGDPQIGTTVALQHVWYEFTIDALHENVAVSLCGSSYDTMMNLYDECGAASIANNDDYCGAQSQIDLPTLDAGTYYVEVLGYSNYYGDYILEVTGNIPPTGESCELALPYYMINDPAQVGATTEAGDFVWYEFYLDSTYYNATVSLLNSEFDTMLEIWADCGDDDYIAFNDDWYGRGPVIQQDKIDKTQSRVSESQIVFDELESGNYYAKIMGYSDYFGNYELEITGDLQILPEIESYSLVSSTDMVTWLPVVNDVVEIDPLFDYTYLNLADMATNIPLLVNEMNEFFVETYPLGWFDYWAAKGVIVGATGWQAIMWEIINSNAPIMYIVDDGRGLMLVDGLLYQLGEGMQNLRVSGDYLLGDYTYTGTILSDTGLTSELVTIPLTFEEPFIAPAGYDCANPYVIETLPYLETGMTTEGFGDDYSSGSACGSSYMNGDDFVFEYVPAENVMVDIALTNTLSWTGLFVTQGCPDDPAAVCIDLATSSSGNPSITGAYLEMGVTYYIIVSTWPTPNFTPFDITITGYEPPLYGDLTGIVTDFDTALPLEGATVVLAEVVERVEFDKNELTPEKIEYLNNQISRDVSVTTDVDGYYEFLGLEIGTFDVTCSYPLYVGDAVQVELLEGLNVQDFALAPVTEWSVHLALTTDYFSSETSYNMWLPEQEAWYWDVDQTFTDAYETIDHYLVLLPGVYEVHCFDSYGDGGIAGYVEDENFVEMLSWGDTDYDDLGIFTFYNDIDPGVMCGTALPYYNINDPAVMGSTVEAGDFVWYEFYLDNEYLDVVVSLLDSDPSFDTKLEVWGDCADDTFIAYNDDWYGRNSMVNQENIDKTQSRVLQSQIVFDSLLAGNYYAKVYGYSSNFGDYTLEITGVNAGLPDGEITDNAIPVVFDEFNYFHDFGDLSEYADDYDMPSGTGGADVVYALTVPMDALVDVSLLASEYDTQLAIYASDVIPGPDNYLFYNDDYTGRMGGNELIDWARPVIINKENSRVSESALYDMPLAAGMYYIVVDAWSTNTGIWDIEVTWEDACQPLECIGTPEGEEMILEGGEDVTNGGCNMVEPLFGAIAPGETVCGMLNNYITATGGTSRDMDWYLSNTGDDYEYYEVTVTLDYDLGDAALWITNGLCGDDLVAYGFYNETGYCSYEQGTAQIAAGDFGIIVSTPDYTGYPDGFNYALNVEVAEYIPPNDVFINVAVDYWYGEASWNVYDYQSETFLFADDFTFTVGYEMQTQALILDPGMYSVVCYDSYGDGGISGNVVHLMQELLAWASIPYSEIWHDFEVGGGMIYGDVDDNGAVEAFDTSNLLQYVVGLDPDAAPLPWNEVTMTVADVDGNFWINAYDGALILQYVVGYIDVFPVELLVRHEAPEAVVDVKFIDGELVFTANGELYGFEATISSEPGTPETDLLYMLNDNMIAIASADPITGEFLRIPVSADEVTIDMVINNTNERLELTEAPIITSLKSNYPNPFNPVTTIAYEVAEAGNVLIQVYNIRGQLVSTLVNEHQERGSHDLLWNADGQASGVYFYKMKFGRYTSTKKMILMK
jgi:type IX secretion system substrate protein/cleaved adhesin domain-containing protein